MNLKPIRAHFVVVVCAVLLAMVWGCGSKVKKGQSKSISVNGTLLVNGKPFGPAVLSFVPQSEGVPGVEARVNKDGTFDLLNYKAGDVEPGGKYKVILSESADPEEMAASAIPDAMPVSVEIQLPADGETLKLEIKMTAKGGKTRSGGPDPDAAGPELPKGPGGI
jgi:hypothetical protein